MTTTVKLTYVGRLRSGVVALPRRHVPFIAGQPVAFELGELAFLDLGDWSGPRHVSGSRLAPLPAPVARTRAQAALWARIEAATPVHPTSIEEAS